MHISASGVIGVFPPNFPIKFSPTQMMRHPQRGGTVRSLGAPTCVGRQLGKACQVAKEMWRLKLAILGVSEQDRQGSGRSI